jgi:adenylate cyclase
MAAKLELSSRGCREIMSKRASGILLRVGISVAFILVIVPVVGVTVGYLYRSTTDLTLDLGAHSMDKATQDIVDDVDTLLNPAVRLVDAAAYLAKFDHDKIRDLDGLHYMFEQIAALPQLYSVYAAYGVDGSFYQVMRVPPGIAAFGPSGHKPPERTRFALRQLDSRAGEKADTFTYLAAWNNAVGVETRPALFDPRVRPWYQDSWKENQTVLSDVYIFSSSQEPGLTISKRVAGDDGSVIGAVGADVSLQSLSQFLDRKRIGTDGRLFVLDADHHILGSSGSGRRVGGAAAAIVLGRDSSDAVIAEAVRHWEAGSGDRFTAALGPGDQDYLVSFAPFPREFQKRWTIGVAINRDEFVGPVRQISLRILFIGALAAMIAVLAILMLSRKLTEPLQSVIRETERIRDFDLDGDFGVRSVIVEVNELGLALDRMKSSLRSFGAYVPKQLVRTIVSSGVGIEVGGERRLLTVMFSDIKDFTRKSESLPPEDVLTGLSSYFEGMSAAVHQNRGTIDKFIGDAIMAIWNAPIEDPDHVSHACMAMLACQAVGEALNYRFEGHKMMPLFTRFGLHMGEMMVGNVGSNDRMQYTVLGSAVNLASRVEGLNKIYGTQLLVTGAVEEAVRDQFAFRAVDRVAPAGLSHPIAIFELVGVREAGTAYSLSRPDALMCARWAESYGFYLRRDWGGALAAFTAFSADYPSDRLAQVYVERCTAYSSAPPPSDWDGAQHFDKK